VRATDELAKLAETLGAPLMTTVRGMGAFEGLQGNLGVFGPSGTPRGQAAIAAADCIIAFGASLNFWTTDRDALTEGRRVVQIDVDPAQLGRWSRIDVGVVGDAGAVADVMRANLEELGVQPRSFAATAREMTVLEASVRHRSPDEPLDVVSALSAIDAAVPGDRTLVVDGGLFILQTFKRMHVESPGAYVHGSCYGSIGLGVGLAVGAAVARPESPTLLVVGDGGFMLGGVNDLWSAVREKLDIIVTLIDDGAFGAEHIQFMRRGMDPSLSYNPWPDLAEVCRSMGAAAVSLKTIADLDKLPTVIGSRSGPLVLHCVIDPDDRGHEAG